MLEGWYCRTLANQQAAAASQQDEDENEPNVADSGSEDSQEGTSNPNTLNRPIDYKEQYKYLKQKLKFLLYENEFFQDALRTSQRRLLKVSRDRSFLLDRLLQYEKPEGSSSESEETESSDESSKIETKKRKYDNSQNSSKNHSTSTTKKKKVTQQKSKSSQNTQSVKNQLYQQQQQQIQEGHMTAEEVERHLQSRQSIAELMPEKATPTVPTEMFSNEPSLDSESNDQVIETSPSNVGEDYVNVDTIVKTEYIKSEYN